MSYRTRDQLIADFLALEAKYPRLMSHEIIGKTAAGKDIYMFKIGNPRGGRVMFTHAHGDEAVCPEVFYYYAVWLLQNREPGVSDRILARNYTLIIPYLHGLHTRKNANRVDLNRNFPKSWRTDCVPTCTSCCSGDADCGTGYECIGATSTRLGNCYKSGCKCGWSDFIEDYNYRGPSAASEPETKALLETLAKLTPKFFFDFHAGGEYFAKPSWRSGITAEQRAYHDHVAQKIRQLALERGAQVFRLTTLGICGSLTDDGCATGKATSFLVELETLHRPPYEEVPTLHLNNFLPFAIVASRECEVPPTPFWKIAAPFLLIFATAIALMKTRR